MNHPSAAFLNAIRAGRPPASLLPVAWRNLAERLAAAHALRQVLGEDTSPTAVPAASGSFNPDVARALAKANNQACRAVNRVASNDGKPADGTRLAGAGTQLPAIEG